MTPTGDPRALGEMLRSRRARLAPSDVGLPDGRRRRTPGLRREEVALLANLSPTYYTFLEQGRQVRPSQQVLDALGGALLMSDVERRYLNALAYGTAAPVTAQLRERLTTGVAELIQRLDPAPTYVKGRRWDVLGSNPAARELFTDWDARPAEDRNLVAWMFTSDEPKRVYVEWELEARAMLGRFRLASARHPDDPAFATLIDALHEQSELVRQWWPSHDVATIGSGTKLLRHPRLGIVHYSHVVLQVADDPSQTLVTFSTPPDRDEARRAD
jgi:transcriptional regulator with XRE-family HTH domain